nr:ribonuclease H-like domain-containing protein [Tanacetum cinerariifolium]
MPLLNPQRHVVPIAVITKSKLVPITTARPVTVAILNPHVTRPRPAKSVVTKPHSLHRRHINRSPSSKVSNFPPKVTSVKVPQGNPQHALKDKGVIDSRCSRHMTRNMSYLSDFEELNGGYVSFGGNPKDLAAIEAYDPEANTKYVATLHALKDLKYPLVDLLEKLKDAPIDVIMASLFLESDSEEDAPQWMRELRPSSSQLKILVYLEVCNPKDPRFFKDEILLEDAIAANAFTISANVPKIFMQQFWYAIKKVKDTESYEFLLANKKCIVDAEVFRNILNIYPRVEGELSYKMMMLLSHSSLTLATKVHYTSIPTCMWITCNSHGKPIINKCLSGKTENNDKLKKSKIDIMWGMFYRENVDYPELIWKDIAFQIDNKKEKKSRHETMSFPRFTKVIINHFLSQHMSLSKLKFQQYHTIKNDGIVSKLKLIKIREDYQEYRLYILDMMLNDKIKQSESYQMFLKYSTDQIPPKRSRGKGSQGKKTADHSQEIVDVSEEFKLEPAKKKVGSLKLKGVQSLTPEEQEATDTMQALKESRKTSRRQPENFTRDFFREKNPWVKAVFVVVVVHSLLLFNVDNQDGSDIDICRTESKHMCDYLMYLLVTYPVMLPVVRSLEVAEMTVDSSETPGILLVLALEPLVPGCLLLVFLLSLRACMEYLEKDKRDDKKVDWIYFDEDEEKKDDANNNKSINLGMTDDEETKDELVLEHAEVYYECMEPFKTLMCLWVRGRSIAATCLEKVVTPLIEPAIKVRDRTMTITSRKTGSNNLSLRGKFVG